DNSILSASNLEGEEFQMKKIGLYLRYGSKIVLIVAAGIIGYDTYKNFWLGVFSVILILIPEFDSLITLHKEHKQKRNNSKNRYSDNLFTDREEDIQSIVNILSMQEHRIEIKGNGEQCGKSWIAKRLCDYINHPKDIAFQRIKSKCPYTVADYIDMDQCSESFLNTYLQSRIISPRTVLIFDHVTNLELIFSKQRLYHFQLIYIMKNMSSKNLSLHHFVSNFNPKYVDALQEKIRETYPEVSRLSHKETDILFQITYGNIGKIVNLLSEERCIDWIKNIASNEQNDYDKNLYFIQVDLYTGKYKEAERKLLNFKNEYCDKFDNNNDLMYKYILILSDCNHLLNKYYDALATLSTIESKQYKANNKNFKIELYKAHYYKHLWMSNESLEILKSIYKESFAAIVDSLGILAAKYFINDLHVPGSLKNSKDEFCNLYIIAQNSTLTHTDEEKNKLKRFTSLYILYTDMPKDCDSLINVSNEIIAIYKAQNNRLLANAYFIQGEIYRVYCKYDEAIKAYLSCINVTKDNNIVIQTNLMVYYLINIKGLKVKFNLLCEENIIDLCENNEYSNKVFQRIRNIELCDPESNNIKKCFDSRIMPIL
ncbi:hypothetical protein, partial [Clostridium sp. HBUAS56010]|uniref:hypothetical protein n=1 Tax=Clostridium sp. HBUAS56010 TaxID=2571127 RepID=UPI001A9C16B3